MLLLGPPGTGKTHAVKAATRLCKAWCAIKVIDLNIPHILADDEPISKVQSLLEEATLGKEGYYEDSNRDESGAVEESTSAASPKSSSTSPHLRLPPLQSLHSHFLPHLLKEALSTTRLLKWQRQRRTRLLERRQRVNNGPSCAW